MSGMSVALFAALLSAALLALTLREWNRTLIAAFACAALLSQSGCAGLMANGYRPPTLESVAGSVDVERAVACAQRPTPKEKARCLGLTTLSAGVNIALQQAASLGAAALRALGGGGADDIDEDALAAELDVAMSKLNTEIAAQKSLGGE